MILIFVVVDGYGVACCLVICMQCVSLLLPKKYILTVGGDSHCVPSAQCVSVLSMFIVVVVQAVIFVAALAAVVM